MLTEMCIEVSSVGVPLRMPTWSELWKRGSRLVLANVTIRIQASEVESSAWDGLGEAGQGFPNKVHKCHLFWIVGVDGDVRPNDVEMMFGIF